MNTTTEIAESLRSLPIDDQVALVYQSLEEVRLRAYEGAYTTAINVAKKYCSSAKYFWEDPEDLANSLMERFPAIWNKFDSENEQGVVWEKYLYWRFYFEAKDYFRRLDPLGIKWPQKKEYPQWHRLGDEGLSAMQFASPDGNSDQEEVVIDDMAELREDWSRWLIEFGRQREVNGYCWCVNDETGEVRKVQVRKTRRRKSVFDERGRAKFRKCHGCTMESFVTARRKRIEHGVQSEFEF